MSKEIEYTIKCETPFEHAVEVAKSKFIASTARKNDNETEFYAIVLYALMTRTPQKPKAFGAELVCPVCGKKVENPTRFCGECGQAIEWKENGK